MMEDPMGLLRLGQKVRVGGEDYYVTTVDLDAPAVAVNPTIEDFIEGKETVRYKPADEIEIRIKLRRTGLDRG